MLFGTKFSKGLPNSDIRKALVELRTKKRIILSGTPFQNNFGELRTVMRLLLSANDEAVVFLRSRKIWTILGTSRMAPSC